ncbi:MAG: alpha/beta fold hydrolase [Alphaproteobacteria bacterium]|nr:alpha/beta fold hydrolase [Alphaproteobacteria bacterium]
MIDGAGRVVVLAGATGDLGGRIAAALVRRGVTVRAVLRAGTKDAAKSALHYVGATTIEVDFDKAAELARACTGADCVVSTLNGLEPIMLGVQGRLLDAAVSAGVPRFMPSDFSLDFTSTRPGDNRNMDLRRAFMARIDKAPIRATSVLNGAFADLLQGPAPIVLRKWHRILYWGDADQPLDFTTKDDVADYAADVALDAGAPRFSRIAGDTVSARDLAALMSRLSGKRYKLFRPGGIGLLSILIKVARTLTPGSDAAFPAWQGMQGARRSRFNHLTEFSNGVPLLTDIIAPFHLSIPQSDLDDLHARLAHTRWPDPETVDDVSQGPPLAKIRALVDRWQDGYDWRRCEALLNGFGQYRTEIDGLGIHFLHIRSPEPDALPLIMTHGWPGSVLEFRDVVGPLTDPAAHGGSASSAFHLVIPSLPGFGFSDKPTESGWNIMRIAAAWSTLMQRLGYDRWAAQGGDWGAGVTTTLGYMTPPGLVGIHLNMVMFQPTDDERADADTAEQKMLADAQRYDEQLSGYYKLQNTRPQSIAFGLADSPVGLAAWIYALFQDVSDSGGDPESVFELDAMLDDIMLYWIPNAGPSSVRLYWEGAQAMKAGGMPSKAMPTPTGISMFPGEQIRLSRRWAEQRFAKLVHFNELDRGGHFAALEQPAVFVEELRATFAGLRSSQSRTALRKSA